MDINASIYFLDDKSVCKFRLTDMDFQLRSRQPHLYSHSFQFIDCISFPSSLQFLFEVATKFIVKKHYLQSNLISTDLH